MEKTLTVASCELNFQEEERGRQDLRMDPEQEEDLQHHKDAQSFVLK